MGAGLVPEPVLIAISGHYKKPAEQLMAKAVGFLHFVLKGADPSPSSVRYRRAMIRR